MLVHSSGTAMSRHHRATPRPRTRVMSARAAPTDRPAASKNAAAIDATLIAAIRSAGRRYASHTTGRSASRRAPPQTARPDARPAPASRSGACANRYNAETIADPKLPAPAINLARANLCPTSDFRDYGARRQALGNNRSFLLSAPTPPPFWASYDLNPRHRTVPNTSGNTITCTGAYQPDPPQLGKAAITAGIRLSGA